VSARQWSRSAERRGPQSPGLHHSHYHSFGRDAESNEKIEASDL
jgi:hypothetical protein